MQILSKHQTIIPIALTSSTGNQKLMINLSSIKSTWRFFWPTYRMSLDQRSDLSLGPLSFSKVVGPAFSTIGSYGGPAEPVVGWPFGLLRLRFPMVFPASRTGLAFSSGSCHGHTTGSGWTLMGRDSCRIHTWRWSTHRENGGLKPTGMECKLHGIELAIWCLVSGSATTPMTIGHYPYIPYWINWGDMTHKHDSQGEPSVEPETYCIQTINVLLDMNIVGSRSHHYFVSMVGSFSVHELLLIETSLVWVTS